MEVRSYYAATLNAAMALARKEFGPEALLLGSNGGDSGVTHPGLYRVASVRPPMLPVQSSPPADLPGKENFSAILASAGVPAEASREFLDGTGRKALPFVTSWTSARSGTHDLACSPGLGRFGFTETAVAFVGPSGAGKTTAMMKLALMHGVQMSRPVRLFSFEPGRVGAASRLGRFAQVWDLKFAEFRTLEALSDAVAQPASGLTLIDTAGYGHDEEQALAEAARCLLGHSKIETQLVLRVDRKTADSLAAMQLFSIFQPARLILTAFDESSDNSDLPSLVEAAELPVSFLGVGQRIPEDLEPARSERLTELILNGWPELARSAA